MIQNHHILYHNLKQPAGALPDEFGGLPAPISENVLGSLTEMPRHGFAMDVGTVPAVLNNQMVLTDITQQ